MSEVTQEMVEAGIAAYGGWQGGKPRSHRELCEQIHLAMLQASGLEKQLAEMRAIIEKTPPSALVGETINGKWLRSWEDANAMLCATLTNNGASNV